MLTLYSDPRIKEEVERWESLTATQKSAQIEAVRYRATLNLEKQANRMDKARRKLQPLVALSPMQPVLLLSSPEKSYSGGVGLVAVAYEGGTYVPAW